MVRFYPSEWAANPIVTDTWSYVLTKEPVSVKVLKDRLYNRVREIESGLERWNAISTALAAGQNTRLKADDVVGG